MSNPLPLLTGAVRHPLDGAHLAGLLTPKSITTLQARSSAPVLLHRFARHSQGPLKGPLEVTRRTDGRRAGAELPTRGMLSSH